MESRPRAKDTECGHIHTWTKHTLQTPQTGFWINPSDGNEKTWKGIKGSGTLTRSQLFTMLDLFKILVWARLLRQKGPVQEKEAMGEFVRCTNPSSCIYALIRRADMISSSAVSDYNNQTHYKSVIKCDISYTAGISSLWIWLRTFSSIALGLFNVCITLLSCVHMIKTDNQLVRALAVYYHIKKCFNIYLIIT